MTSQNAEKFLLTELRPHAPLVEKKCHEAQRKQQIFLSAIFNHHFKHLQNNFFYLF
jgi:hypothetical protein